MKTFVIAESGSTWRIGKDHKKHLAYGLKSIRVAKAAGADAWKCQWTSDPRAMEKRRKVPVGTYDILHWPVQWLKQFAAACEEAGIEFLCTVFLPQDVPVIAPLVKRFKVASLEATSNDIYAACYPYKLPLVVSLGALESDGVKFVMGATNLKASYLQCVAAYPAPIGVMNLRVIREWCPTVTMGLSDHSGDVLTGALAVAAGAEIIEVHFRLDRTPKDNPDFPHSLTPYDLCAYVANVRKAELMMGDGIKKIEECEKAMVPHRVTA